MAGMAGMAVYCLQAKRFIEIYIYNYIYTYIFMYNVICSVKIYIYIYYVCACVHCGVAVHTELADRASRARIVYSI
jgi:hypothetical protein